MKDFFGETHLLRAVMYDELDQAEGTIRPGEILFVNWESINKEKNVMVRDTEQSMSIYEITRRTREEQQLPIVVVIDEEHLFWSKSADKSAKVLQKIKAKVEIRISATPKTSSDYMVTIPREEVVREEMIKKQVMLNPDINRGYNDVRELNQHLIACALDKRDQLAHAYRRLGVDINPLLLIQLPNDTSEAMTADDNDIAQQVKAYLRHVRGIGEENGRLAIWLSKEKANIDQLERHDNMADVLLFKQAIALGWDCPRAAVLLIFRKMQSDTFTIQTVGRILRMPQQKFYTDNALNVGYVYTDISKDKIIIVAEDMDYLNKDALQATRRENLQNVLLKSYYSVYKSSDRNRLGPDFKSVLIDCFKRNWFVESPRDIFAFDEMTGDGGDIVAEAMAAASSEPTPNDPCTTTPANAPSPAASNRQRMEGKIRFDVKNINVEIPADIVFQNEVGIIDVGERSKFARTAGELHRIFTDYCRTMIGGRYERAHSTGVLAGYLLEVMEELFDLFETDAKKVVLYHANKPRFTEIIQKALNNYERKLKSRQRQARQRAFVAYDWEVPPERLYKEQTHRVVDEVKDHALLPFIEQQGASTPEQRFRDFLEAHADSIEWWYKNGDEGKQHYAIPYMTATGDKALFYVDFILRMGDGQVFLFDTKTELSDPEAPNKHNALLEYMQRPEQAQDHLKGGVVIEKNGVWYYPQHPITTTADVAGWVAFYPEDHKKQ